MRRRGRLPDETTMTDADWDARYEAALKQEWRSDRWRAFRETLKQRGLTDTGHALGDPSPGRARRLLVVARALVLMPWASPCEPDDPDRDHYVLACWNISGPSYHDGSYDWTDAAIPQRIFARPRIYRDGG